MRLCIFVDEEKNLQTIVVFGRGEICAACNHVKRMLKRLII